MKESTIEARRRAQRKYAKSEKGILVERKFAIKRRAKAKKNGAHFAMGQIRQALVSGAIQKKHCERCGSPNSQAHHEDYNKPLDVMWLCPLDHMKRHKEIRHERKMASSI